ncbi:MAG: hypothetical protein GEU88_14260 [Solirubrobacterales bacterium]|nr:hypothetical protein [Solirubrobacterales bacterium]
MRRVQVTGGVGDQARVLSDDGLELVAALHDAFEGRRRESLNVCKGRQRHLDAGAMLAFLAEIREILESTGLSARPLRRSETARGDHRPGRAQDDDQPLTLTPAPKAFLCDFEDALTPPRANVIAGQANLFDAVQGTTELTRPDGRVYRPGEEVATHGDLPTRVASTLVNGEAVSASFVDFGRFMTHNGPRLAADGRGQFLLLPKLEGHLEARL